MHRERRARGPKGSRYDRGDHRANFCRGDHDDQRAALAISKNTAAALPPLEEGTEQLAEAIQRALPIVRMLDRYERRAIARRDKVITTCLESKRLDGTQIGRTNQI